jgi:flagellar FliL protein
MADEERDTEVEEPKKKSPIVLIIVLVLVGLIAVGAITYIVASKVIADSANAGGGEPKYHDPGVFVQLGDPKEGILVNVGGPKSGKFLKTKIILELNPGKKDNVEEGKINPIAETKVMDRILQLLRSTKLDEFDAAKQDELKKKLKDQLNEELGEGSVYDVYITSFLLQ